MSDRLYFDFDKEADTVIVKDKKSNDVWVGSERLDKKDKEIEELKDKLKKQIEYKKAYEYYCKKHVASMKEAMEDECTMIHRDIGEWCSELETMVDERDKQIEVLKLTVKGLEENYKFMEDCYNAERQTVMDLRAEQKDSNNEWCTSCIQTSAKG